MPSAPQNRLRAYGRSIETQTTRVFGSEAASSLKRRTLIAQMPVSMLGKMFKHEPLPASSSLESSG